MIRALRDRVCILEARSILDKREVTESLRQEFSDTLSQFAKVSEVSHLKTELVSLREHMEGRSSESQLHDSLSSSVLGWRLRFPLCVGALMVCFLLWRPCLRVSLRCSLPVPRRQPCSLIMVVHLMLAVFLSTKRCFLLLLLDALCTRLG